MSRTGSIQRKVTGALFGTIALALVLMAIGLAAYEYKEAEPRLQTNLELLAESMFASVVPAVDFNLPSVANETLARYRNNASIRSIWLFRQGAGDEPRLFASAPARDPAGAPAPPGAFPPAPRPDGFLVHGDAALLVITQTRPGSQPLTLQIEGSLTSVRRRLRDSLLILGAVFVVLLVVGAGLSHLLQKALTRPIRQLADTARAISATEDYSLRADISSNDEIGQLGQRFNEMIQRLAERDQRIVNAHAFQTAILESTGVAVVSCDAAGTVSSFNLAAEQLLGYTRKDVVGKATPSLWHLESEVARRAQELSRELGRPVDPGFSVFVSRVLDGAPETREWTWRRRDGSTFPVQLVVSAMRDPRTRLIGFCGLATDLTERKRAEESLRASEHRYRIVIDQTGQMIYDLDIRSGVNQWFGASAVRQITGYDLAEFQQVTLQGWGEMIHPDDRAAALENFNQSCAAGLPYNAVYRFRHRDGTYRTIQDLGVFLRDGRGEVHQMLGVMSDVTQRVESEEAIRRLNVELEQRVRERTAELGRRVSEVEQLNADQRALMQSLASSQQNADRAAARLQQANSSLLIANQELEAFSYSVSHDLRAPLRNITGFLELLERRSAGHLDAEAARYVTVVIAEARRMGLLIDDLLTFSRIGRTEMNLQEVSIATLVDEVRQEIASDVGERSITWLLGPLPLVQGDRSLLRQVIANLVSNAVKFTRRKAAATIEIGVGASRPGDAYATFFVRDNGAGFNPKYHDKLFGVFQRLHNARDFEGTGIGLANVKRIVTRHGGRVWAEGAVERGAVFYFTLPTASSARSVLSAS